jgi:hypothetical protein
MRNLLPIGHARRHLGQSWGEHHRHQGRLIPSPPWGLLRPRRLGALGQAVAFVRSSQVQVGPGRAWMWRQGLPLRGRVSVVGVWSYAHVRDCALAEVLERWSKDYGLLRSNTVRRYLQPRGLLALMSGLAAVQDVRYAVTGSVAAQEWAPYAPARSAMIYTDDPDRLAAGLDLREIDTGKPPRTATSRSTQGLSALNR